ncbi:AAA family ATPase [Brevibacterium casei]
MPQVLLAVDFEFDLILFELLSDLDDVEVVARPADEVELLALCRTGDADVAILGEYFPGLDAEVVAQIQATGTKVLGVGGDEAALARLGITASVPATAEAAAVSRALDDVLRSAVVPPRPSSPPSRGRAKGRIVTVWGTGSSPGRTLTAVNLADQAARLGNRCVLVDADTVGAMAATTLGLTEESSHLASLCRLTVEKSPPTEVAAVPHASVREDFHVVTGLTRPERWPEVRGAVLKTVLHDLAGLYDAVIVDVSDRLDPDDEFADPFYDRHAATRAALDAADTVLVLASGDPIGLQKLVRLLGTDRAEALRDRMHIGITKVRASAVGAPAKARICEALERFAGRAPDFVFSDDRARVDAALLAGRTLGEVDPRSALTREFAEAAAELVPAHRRVRRRERLRS